MLNDISEHGNPVMEAGFQWIAPEASSGQPAATPPIDSLMALTPRNAIPCAQAEEPIIKNVRKTPTFAQ
jgi:hypothetical protein